GRRRKRARSDWSPLMVGGRRLFLASDDDARVLRILETLDPDTLAAVLALHVTAGSEPGIAASPSVPPGEAARRLPAIRDPGARRAFASTRSADACPAGAQRTPSTKTV